MPISIQNISIIDLDVDAIVNAANNSLLGGGGVDGVIHRAAGPDLLAECRLLNGCETGAAKITKGYDLRANFVIHTVGPIWRGGRLNEPELLSQCYSRSLHLAIENEIQSIAFPAISTGAYNYPMDEAADIAIHSVSEFLRSYLDIDVIFAVFGRKAERAFNRALQNHSH